MPALQTSIFGQMSFTATDLYHKLQSLLPTTSSHGHTPSSLNLPSFPFLAIDLRVARVPSSITTNSFILQQPKQLGNLSFYSSLSAAWKAKTVPGAPTDIGSQASRHLTQEHATLIGINEQENPGGSLSEFLLFIVLIFSVFPTTDENFLSIWVNGSFNKELWLKLMTFICGSN